MSVAVRPADSSLGALVSGVSLAKLDPAEWRAIEDAFHAHAVLIFPGQGLTHDEQVAFGRRFGELDSLVAKTGRVPISNLDSDGSTRPEGDPLMNVLRGNEVWHTDSSYMPVSAKCSVLSAEVVPPTGGETEWADMRAAYDALEPALRARVDGLRAHHSIKQAQARLGYGNDGRFYGFGDFPPPLRPLVKVHPVTGRKALFIGRHAYGIPGVDEDESRKLLDDLLAFACRPPRLLRHRWQPGDVAVWDNRCVLHRARPWNRSLPRVMHHTRIAGDPATESGLAG